MSSIITGPSQGWGSFFSVTPMTLAPSGSQTLIPSGTNLSLPGKASFETWNATTQKFFIMTRGSGTPPMVPLENFGAGTWYARMLPSGTVQIGDTKTSWLTAGSSGASNPIPGLSTLTRAQFETLSKVEQAAVVTLRQASQLAAGYSSRIIEIGLSETPRVGYEMSGGLVVKHDLSAIGVRLPPAAKPVGLEPTPGMKLDLNRDGEIDIPYYNLPGDAGGNTGALISAGAESLFPTLDGYNHSLTDTISNKKPSTFDTWTPTVVDTDATKAEAFLKDFSTWHSSFQTEWVNVYATAANPVVEMPKGSAVPIVSLFITNQDPRLVVNVATITKEAIAKLSQDDQTTLLKSKLFTEYMASQLGVAIAVWQNPTADNPLNPDPTIVGADVQRVATDFNDFYKLAAANLPANPNASTPPAFDGRPFADQLNILRDKMMSGGMVNTKLVSKEILDLRQRYDRAVNYYKAGFGTQSQTNTDTVIIRHDGLNSGNPLGIAVDTNIVSTDNAETIKQGYRTFIAQEQKLAENAKKRYAATDETNFPGLNGKPFDLPTLIYYLQDLYNSDLEAQVTIETESVRQTNAYLKDYADWQDMVNNTLSKWGKDDTNEKGLNGGSAGEGNVFLNKGMSERQVKLALMFDSQRAGIRHPVEMAVTGQSEKVTRPADFEIFVKNTDDNYGTNYDFTQHTRDAWQTYGTRLGEKVTQLNQDSQQKMNDINNMDKQRNRHYDLANSALSKMNDALQAILRATG